MRLEVERGIDQIGSIYQFSPATEVGPFFRGRVNCKHSVAVGFNRQLQSVFEVLDFAFTTVNRRVLDSQVCFKAVMGKLFDWWAARG